jgi:hypothetical protein
MRYCQQTVSSRDSNLQVELLETLAFLWKILENQVSSTLNNWHRYPLLNTAFQSTLTHRGRINLEVFDLIEILRV